MRFITLPVGDDPDEAEVQGDVYRLYHRADGRTLSALTGHTDGANRLVHWDLAAVAAVGSAGVSGDDEHDICFPEPEFSPDGEWLAYGDRLARAADPDRYVVLRRGPLPPGGYYMRLGFSPDGATVYALHKGRIDRWAVADARPLLGHFDRPVAPHPAPLAGVDGEDFAVSPAGGLLVATADRVVLRWELPGHRPLPPVAYPPRSGPVRGLRFSGDGGTLSGASRDGVHVWDARTGEFRRTVRPGLAFPLDWDLLPDGGRLVAADGGAGVSVWDTTTGEQLAGFDPCGRVGEVRAVAVAPDGLTAVAGGTAGRLARWDL